MTLVSWRTLGRSLLLIALAPLAAQASPTPRIGAEFFVDPAALSARIAPRRQYTTVSKECGVSSSCEPEPSCRAVEPSEHATSASRAPSLALAAMASM